ncbi:MAG: hypothetical protein GX073_02700 [Firmicutes bacterium]|nr:hypothetical protein [Bacillota bacterium]
MNNTFTAVGHRHFVDFFQAFPNAARKDLCHGCDGSLAFEGGFFPPTCLLPGELEWLQKTGAHWTPAVEPILTPHGTIYCLRPAALCPYRQSSTFPSGKAAPHQPVESAIYPLVFHRHGSDELRISPFCRRRSAFHTACFMVKAKVAVAVYLLPYLEESWLRHRNALHFPLDPGRYHRLKEEKAGQPITLDEFKKCVAEGFD